MVLDYAISAKKYSKIVPLNILWTPNVFTDSMDLWSFIICKNMGGP